MFNLPAILSARLPFFYGWVVIGCVCCAGFARQGPAVATLSIFVEPMTSEFGWSRTAISGAVSIGGLLAAVASPLLGPLVDRHGARLMLCGAVLTTGLAALALSWTTSLLMFYMLFCFARMNFAGPFDLGIYSAINTWFVRKRPQATSVVTLVMMVGLTAMPMIAHAAIYRDDWRSGWLIVGLIMLIIGFVPGILLMVRQPEDLGLRPDGARPGNAVDDNQTGSTTAAIEPEFTRAQAMRTPTFWLLLGFTLMVYPVQAGVSLHQAPHLVERGLDTTTAALVVSTFSLVSGVAALVYGAVARRFDIRISLVVSALTLGIGTAMMIEISTAAEAVASSVIFGLGIGGMLTIPPIVWADYFGRRSFGAIRGVALTAQVSAQAAGPVISGAFRDMAGDYTLSLCFFAVMASAAAVVACFTRPPRIP